MRTQVPKTPTPIPILMRVSSEGVVAPVLKIPFCDGDCVVGNVDKGVGGDCVVDNIAKGVVLVSLLCQHCSAKYSEKIQHDI